MTPDRTGNNQSPLPYIIESARKGEDVEVFTLEVEGKKAVMAWFDKERHIFGAYWPDLSQSPVDFFTKAQALVDRLGQLPDIPAGIGYSGFIIYAFEDEDSNRHKPRRVDMQSFSPPEEWDTRRVVFARYNTPLAHFSVEEMGDGRLGGEFITHVGKTEEFSQFVVDNNGNPLTLGAVSELLDKAAKSAQTNLFQLTR